ncbi:tetratricopeptide repeat protein [Tamlana sp. 2_MG-2023]|uniref:tetratricopeptide repeat protein n=1 Tax=unclassified Tamlana TaxID=2614803 RepID=UPI0026E37641|nr:MULTISPECIES: tetratricopeptide repeat protein [unclassified Tamlana]MDO6758625.1 tetratricopeptide repeat protein [Tamlana sp. 2_MG-2023]MDO6789324.1 tetratricopeptide repeat protein [Tamlana sp. 1_MG-2023]
MKNLLLTLCVALPLLTFGQANKLYRQALRTTDLEERISMLNDVIDLEPNNLDAYFQRGLAKNNSEDFYGAIVDYSKIIVENPDADTYYNRGNSRYSVQDYTEAKEDYAKAYILDDKFIDALYSLACVRLELGEYEKAISDFDKVIKSVPGQPKTYTLRASAYHALENYQKAHIDYSTAILIEKSSENYYNRGVFFMEITRYQDAKNDFNNALFLDKSNAFAYFFRGASSLFLGEDAEAISDFEQVLEFDSTDFDAELGLAIAYINLNDNVKAKHHFDRANNILSIGSNVTSILQYNETYWFQHQYFFFNKAINALVKL